MLAGWARCHRGTPWQTVYLKATDVVTGTPNGLYTWTNWCGNGQYVFNYGQINTSLVGISNWVADALFTCPTNDWRLLEVFTAGLNDNATRGQLSINQASLPAWSGVFGGAIALQGDTNSHVDNLNPGYNFSPVNYRPGGNAWH